MEENSKKKTLVIIPAFNEQENIGHVLKKIREVDKAIDIVVIDDGSSDRTAYVSKLHGAKVIKLSSHMGYGVALQTGYKYAFRTGYDYLVQLDGDRQHDPAYIPDLLKAVTSGDTDLVLGSRFLQKTLPPKAHLREHVPGVPRKLGIRFFAYLTSLLVGFRVTDPTSGYQALSKRLISFFVRDLFPCDYPDADVILIAHRAGFRIKELPIVVYERYDGSSMHRGLKPAYYTFKMFLSMLMTMLRRKPPFLRNERAFKERFFGP
ncbi:MAG: glycosyltransferase family 2 protein [Planctomycetota bacterium]|jgi:glycosyltransferase involved in cell wall biosynthesis